MTPPIKVGIVDDHPGVRVGLKNLLASATDIIVVGEGENGEEAIQLVEQKKPDVLLLDVELPLLRGDLVMKHLRETNMEVIVLAVSSYNDPVYVQGMLDNGAAGYITKEEVPRYLVDALHSIIEDHVKWISPIVKQLSKIELDDVSLTGGDLDILRLIVLGRADAEIMRELKLGETDFGRSIDTLQQKFGIDSRDALYAAAECILSTTAA